MLLQFFKSAAQTSERGSNLIAFCCFYIINLMIIFKQRYGHDDPPACINKQGNTDRRHHGDSQRIIHQNKHQTDDKWNTASDISPGISFGGNRIHPLRCGNVCQHGIVKYQTGRITGFGDNKHHQKHNPGTGNGQRCTSYRTHQHGADKNRFLHAFLIGKCTEYRSNKCHQQGGYGGSVSPPGQIIRAGNPGIFRQTVKINWQDRCHQQGKSRVSHIVQNPAQLLLCQLFAFYFTIFLLVIFLFMIFLFAIHL